MELLLLRGVQSGTGGTPRTVRHEHRMELSRRTGTTAGSDSAAGHGTDDPAHTRTQGRCHPRRRTSGRTLRLTLARRTRTSSSPAARMSCVPENPLIVQGDRSILLETASPRFSRQEMLCWGSPNCEVPGIRPHVASRSRSGTQPQADTPRTGSSRRCVKYEFRFRTACRLHRRQDVPIRRPSTGAGRGMAAPRGALRGGPRGSPGHQGRPRPAWRCRRLRCRSCLPPSTGGTQAGADRLRPSRRRPRRVRGRRSARDGPLLHPPGWPSMVDARLPDRSGGRLPRRTRSGLRCPCCLAVPERPSSAWPRWTPRDAHADSLHEAPPFSNGRPGSAEDALTEADIEEWRRRAEAATVTLTTYWLLRGVGQAQRAGPAGLLSRTLGLVVYDEVHLLPAPVFREVAEVQARRRLGRPQPGPGRRHGGRCLALVGPRRFDLPWKTLEAQGWIATAAASRCGSLSTEDRTRYTRAGARDDSSSATNPEGGRGRRHPATPSRAHYAHPGCIRRST